MATEQVRSKIERSLKQAFNAPDDQVKVEFTPTSHVWATVVSDSFHDQPVEDRQRRIWDHLHSSLEEGEMAEVVLTLALSPFEAWDDDDTAQAQQ
jgi:acid stress-induced BolA-like protein IbaG/YrbA